MATEHPDRQWINNTIAALYDWCESPAAAPTSQITGSGAVGAAEQLISAQHNGRPALLVPSATFGMLSVLLALDIGPGDEVLIPELDWTSTLAVVRTLGATPVSVPVSADTWTIDADAAHALRTEKARAVVACHLFGIPADIPALRQALPDLPLIEDCAQAFGSTLDGTQVGSLGDAAVFSFGPGKKPIDVGEAGAVVVRDEDFRDALLQASAHPIRQQHAGVLTPSAAPLSLRVHPIAAVLIAQALTRVDPSAVIMGRRHLVADLLLTTALPLLGADSRRGVATHSVPVSLDDIAGEPLPSGVAVRQHSVHDIRSELSGTSRMRTATLLSRPSPAYPAAALAAATVTSPDSTTQAAPAHSESRERR